MGEDEADQNQSEIRRAARKVMIGLTLKGTQIDGNKKPIKRRMNWGRELEVSRGELASHLVTQSNEVAEEARHRLHLRQWALLGPPVIVGTRLCQEEAVAILALLRGRLCSDWVVHFSSSPAQQVSRLRNSAHRLSRHQCSFASPFNAL